MIQKKAITALANLFAGVIFTLSHVHFENLIVLFQKLFITKLML
jgi:hypothetical protein